MPCNDSWQNQHVSSNKNNLEIKRLFDSIGRSFNMKTALQQSHTPAHENSFQEYGSSCLALVFQNEYGITGSLKLIENYLKRVQTILYETLLPSPTKKELSREFERIHQNWIYLSWFHRNREKFKEAKAIGVIQHTSKWVFRLISKWDISFIHRNLAERLCRFHGQLSSIIQK